MSKIVRLTESDLVRLVKKVISEQVGSGVKFGSIMTNDGKIVEKSLKPVNRNKLTVMNVNGTVVLDPKGKNQKLTPGMVVRVEDMVDVKPGGSVTFRDVEGWGMGELHLKDGKPYMRVHWD